MSDINFNLPPGSRVHGIKRKRIETPAQIALRNSKAAEQKKAKSKSRGINPELNIFLELGRQSTDEACLEYVSLFQGNRISKIRPDGWLSSPTLYPGREHVDILKLGKIWFQVMENWLKYRSNVQGFESNKDPKGSIHILVDYLLLYLPWWKELHPEAAIELVETPKKFLRYPFISRTIFEDKSTSKSEALPMTPGFNCEVRQFRD